MQLYSKEFNAALSEAEKINDRNFKGKLMYGAGKLIQETAETLLFRFTYEKDTDGFGHGETREEEQSKISSISNVKLFTGIIDCRHNTSTDKSRMYIDVLIVKDGLYDKYKRRTEQQQRQEILMRMRGTK